MRGWTRQRSGSSTRGWSPEVSRPWVVERRKVLKRGSLAKGTEPTYHWLPAPKWGDFRTRKAAQLHLARALDPRQVGLSDAFVLDTFLARMRNDQTHRVVRAPDPQLTLF